LSTIESIPALWHKHSQHTKPLLPSLRQQWDIVSCRTMFIINRIFHQVPIPRCKDYCEYSSAFVKRNALLLLVCNQMTFQIPDVSFLYPYPWRKRSYFLQDILQLSVSYLYLLIQTLAQFSKSVNSFVRFTLFCSSLMFFKKGL
jgi:hypothetical protein